MLLRLERIEQLDRDGAPPGALLEEVRSLLREAEAWLAVEAGADGGAAAALEGCRAALEGCRAALEGAGNAWGAVAGLW